MKALLSLTARIDYADVNYDSEFVSGSSLKLK